MAALTNDLVTRLQPGLLAFCRILTRDYHDALDLYQDVWLRVLRYRVSLAKNDSQAFRLLARIARNTFLTGLSRRPLFSLSAQDLAVLSQSFQEVERADILRRLEELVSSLPVPEQVVFWVRQEMRGLSWEAVAEFLGISPHTVKKRYARSLRRLRAMMPKVQD